MRVAVLGMGKMGHAMALRLMDGGYQVSVWNRTKRPFPELAHGGAQILDTPAQSWDHADYVISFVSDDNALASVYLGDQGVLAGNAQNGIAIDMSTVSPEVSARVAEQAENIGIGYLCSPVSGNPQALAGGRLTLLVSGPKVTFDRAHDLLMACGPKVLYLGQAEQARIAKLAINSFLAAMAEMLAEIIVLCESNGIDRATIVDVIGNSSVGSPFVASKAPGIINRNYDATFTTAMLSKDLRLALDVAARSGISLPVTSLTAELMAKTCDIGFAEVDFTALLPRLQVELGIEPDLPIPKR